MKMLAMMAVVAGACLAGCEREDVTKGMDPAVDGVSKNAVSPVNMSILEDPKKLYESRTTGGSAAAGNVAVAPAATSTTSAPATATAPSTEPATEPTTEPTTAPTTGPEKAPAPPEGGGEIAPPPPTGG